MKLYNKEKNVNLIINDDILERLVDIGLKNYPNECGGFLVGYYSEDFLTLTITDFVLPKKFDSSSFSFSRSIDGLKEILYKMFQLNKHFYIGEWHTHPNGNLNYSHTDLNAMIEIANCDTITITNPILLIVGINKKEMKEFSFYIYNNKGLYKYE